MKSFLTGILAAAVIAAVAAFVLDTEVQRGVAQQFVTSSVRL